MKEITNNLYKVFVPKAALIAYQVKDSSSSNDGYLERREVMADGSLGVAKPVSRQFVSRLLESFESKASNSPHGRMPANMLYADLRPGKETYVWWTPPGLKNQYFIDKTILPDGQYHMPGCIFAVRNGKLYVFCFKGTKPTPGKKLLYGPFFNYYDDGKICTGSAKVKWPTNPTWEQLQQGWEKIFWSSENAHTISNPIKKGSSLVPALKAAIDTPFNTSILKEYTHTLQSLLSSYEK